MGHDMTSKATLGTITTSYHCSRCAPYPCFGHVDEPLSSEPRVWMPMPPVRTDRITTQPAPAPRLTNGELAVAIKEAWDALNSAATSRASDAAYAHLNALLAEQLRRAAGGA